VFIGEPTGSSPQFWGDHRVTELANSGISVSASPTWWQPGGPYDRREFLPPLLAFEPRFADWVAGRDPAVEATLTWGEQELALDLARDEPGFAALAAGDSAALGRVAEAVRAWDANPVHRYRPVTAELNREGYALLNDGKLEAALTMFRLNVELHPDYANGWDSLGDALLRAGRRDEGLDAYRRAYGLDPEAGTAAAVLGEEEDGH
jgi:tetratricopeptide (TPR) repeat protein